MLLFATWCYTVATWCYTVTTWCFTVAPTDKVLEMYDVTSCSGESGCR